MRCAWRPPFEATKMIGSIPFPFHAPATRGVIRSKANSSPESDLGFVGLFLPF
ncbi:MAG: hypothetical protein K0S56_2779 [Microvirga sp.]|nr:hypothetical protein [Microvirga sp.]